MLLLAVLGWCASVAGLINVALSKRGRWTMLAVIAWAGSFVGGWALLHHTHWSGV